MTGRPPADIVAELDAEVTDLHSRMATAETLWQSVIEGWDALRPPCPTCGGTHEIHLGWSDAMGEQFGPCPDCVDGKQSWEQVVRDAALWKARTP